MKTYIGTKIIEAEPGKRGEETGFKVRYPDGYVSWSPTQPFEDAYQPTNAMSFGHAVEMLKRGERVQRAGWNGKGMYVYYVPANNYRPTTPAATKEFGGGPVPYNAYLAIKNVDRSISTWVPSINDVLADDWAVLGEEA